MSSSSLSSETRKILSKWAREDFCVYLRPISSRLIEGQNSKHKVYWSVSVELRTVPPGQWRGEGYNLDEVILEMASKVPSSKKEHREAIRARGAGWGAPESVLRAEIDRASASIKQAKKKRALDKPAKSERPRKRPKRG